jgi:hypothetical protein
MKRDGLIALDHAHEVLLLKPQLLADIAAGEASRKGFCRPA